MHHGMPGRPPLDPNARRTDGFPSRGGASPPGVPAFHARQAVRGDDDSYEQEGEEDDEGDEDAIDVSEIKGVDRARGRLLPWFRNIVNSVEEEQSSLHVVLVQVTSQGGAQDVTGIPHDLATPPDDTINQLLAIAAEDMCGADFSGSKISYSILVKLQNGTTERQTFVLEIPRPRNATAMTHPPRREHFPDPNGVVGMFMEQNLKLTQFALEGANTGKEVLQRHCDRLEEENRYLKRTQFSRDREMQILLDGNLQRQFMVDEHRAKVERDAKIGDGFKAIVPHILPLVLPPNMAASIQAIAGPMPGAQPTPAAQSAEPQGGFSSPDMSGMAPSDTAILDELIGELEEDQAFFMKLYGVMSEKPRCAQLLGALYESSNARRQAAR